MQTILEHHTCSTLHASHCEFASILHADMLLCSRCQRPCCRYCVALSSDIFLRAGSCYEYRHVVLPQAIAQHVPSERLLSEPEWRGLGVQQSRGECLAIALPPAGTSVAHCAGLALALQVTLQSDLKMDAPSVLSA